MNNGRQVAGMGLPGGKAAWRRTLNAGRAARLLSRTAAVRRAERQALATHLATHLGSVIGNSGGVVAAYHPYRSEPDLSLFLHDLQVEGVPLLFPDEDYGHPAWHQTGTGGPGMGDVSAILIPGLAFDEGGARLGRGLGWYDRALHLLPSGAPRWGVCFPGEVFPAGMLPRHSHDLPVDGVVTPDGATRFLPPGQ